LEKTCPLRAGYFPLHLAKKHVLPHGRYALSQDFENLQGEINAFTAHKMIGQQRQFFLVSSQWLKESH